MSAEVVLTGSVDALFEREVAHVLARIEKRYPGPLDGNPEGLAVIRDALHAALAVGAGAQCQLDRDRPDRLEAGPEAWEQWQRMKDETPEAQNWPDDLATDFPSAVADAGEVLNAAGQELGFHRSWRHDLRCEGEELAEAGAALVRSLLHPPEPEPEPVLAEPGQVGAVQSDGNVRVAFAANLAEAELIQGLLRAAGIPSFLRDAGSQLPQFGAAAPRQVYVPAASANQAQLALSTRRPPGVTTSAPKTATVGLERTGVRLSGKATAVLMLLGPATAVVYSLAWDHPGAAIFSGAVVVVVIAAIVTWSERRRDFD
jgi:hypothetical protein